MKNSVVVALSGGLGNQMFQYAVGRSLAWRHGSSLLLDARALAKDPLRKYGLGHLRIDARLAEPAELPLAPGRIRRRLGVLPRWLTGNAYAVEQRYTFEPSTLRLKPPVLLAGNWQSERYFTDCAEVIRADLQMRDAFTADRAAIADVIRKGNAVSVHVRRGDYVSNAASNAYHGTCDPDWYEEAQVHIDRAVPDARYVVFSDDPDWARENLKTFAGSMFVVPAGDGRDEQDLHLMALCRHHIIANSSFSWWGAWLNPHSDKVVVAPKQWFKGASHDTSDLIPRKWVRL